MVGGWAAGDAAAAVGDSELPPDVAVWEERAPSDSELCGEGGPLGGLHLRARGQKACTALYRAERRPDWQWRQSLAVTHFQRPTVLPVGSETKRPLKLGLDAGTQRQDGMRAKGGLSKRGKRKRGKDVCTCVTLCAISVCSVAYGNSAHTRAPNSAQRKVA